MVITNKENTSQNDPINVLVAHEQKHKNAACICSFSRSRNLLVDCFRSQGWVLWLRVTMFPNRGLCERFLPIFKILVSHNLFSVTNNIQSYLLEELNVIDWIVYKAYRCVRTKYKWVRFQSKVRANFKHQTRFSYIYFRCKIWRLKFLM